MPASAVQNKILVVEDDAVSRIALTGVLSRIPGVSVVEAEDGLVAWDLLSSGLRPVVCCSDIAMPGLDGLALMERARAHPVLRQLPIVLITGSSDRATVQQAIAQGAAGYIVKPFVGIDTRNTIARVLREALARQCEAPARTRTRTGQDAAGLAAMLSALRDDARLEESTAPDATSEEALAERLARLRIACLTLGLWGAATASNQPLQGRARRGELQAVLREIACAAQDQLTRLSAESDAARSSPPLTQADALEPRA